MATHDNPTTFGRARLPFSREADIDEFAEALGRFERGEMTPAGRPRLKTVSSSSWKSRSSRATIWFHSFWGSDAHIP